MWWRPWTATRDIPAPVRAKLKARMAQRDYDEIVSIQRDGIKGSKAIYGSTISDMHFGANNVCKTVSRAKWTQKYEERGLVYCEDGQCILVPTVCRNVSRIQRMTPRASAPAAATNVASAAQEIDDPQSQLEMDPPAAGALGGGAPDSGRNSFAQLASGANTGFDGGQWRHARCPGAQQSADLQWQQPRPVGGRLQRALAAAQHRGDHPSRAGARKLGPVCRRTAGPGLPGQAPPALILSSSVGAAVSRQRQHHAQARLLGNKAFR